MTSTKKKPVPKSNISSKWKRGVRDRITDQQKQKGNKKSKNFEPQAKLMPWERQPVICPYCSQRALLVTGKVIYPHRTDLHELNFWLCDPCNAYVGTHKAGIGWGNGTRPKGTLANSLTRDARKAAHAAFDPLWQRGDLSRRKAYAWLASALGLTVDQTHIGIFDVQTCMRVVAICRGRMKQSRMALAA